MGDRAKAPQDVPKKLSSIGHFAPPHLSRALATAFLRDGSSHAMPHLPASLSYTIAPHGLRSPMSRSRVSRPSSDLAGARQLALALEFRDGDLQARGVAEFGSKFNS